MTPRPAVVTGASSGIGRETAIVLSEAGCEVLLTGRDIQKLQKAAALCAGKTVCLAGDLTQDGFISKLITLARTMSGAGLPILINSAGLAIAGPTHEMSTFDIDAILDINLKAPLQLSRAFIPWLLERGGGDIVNVSSISGKVAFPGGAAYVASKAGLNALTRSLNAEYRRQGIRLTCMIPGSTDTELWDRMSWVPEREDMIPARAVAEAIRDAALAPRDRSFDEIVLMPPKGIL